MYTMTMEIKVYVNGEPVELQSPKVAVGDLIKAGGGDPDKYELERRKGEKGEVEEKYEDPKALIEVKDGDYFTTKYTGPINPA